ncbi:hypothetical protein BCU71_06525 [Vibrio lentus]|uniref:hypothetical protein n=1 Tax=Vibrio lentus TaxID=136468 RepID=UPI000C824FD8|nr:hypothetical protein [Vibrio lentus]PMH28221.1 hypothetical protein BCU71_06525 [Vibrio lentus]PMK70202.1 hypothetical protein BCT93_06160 [Vibrio lentus]
MYNDSVFIITKPSQYITARNIAKSIDKIESPLLYIVGSFSESRKFYHQVKEHDFLWGRVEFFNSRLHALCYKMFHCRSLPLFTDSDIYKDSILNRLSSSYDIYVYDEGFYSYLDDLESHLINQGKCFRRMLYNVLKLPKYHGGSPYTTGLYLYSISSKSKVNNVIEISTGFFDSLNEDIDVLNSVFNFSKTSKLFNDLTKMKRPTIYCTSHSLDNLMASMERGVKFDFIKLHPIINDEIINLNSNLKGKVLIPAFVPIELVIANVIDDVDFVNIVHEGSSIILNMRGLLKKNKIKETNVGMFVDKFKCNFDEVRNND